ncbi:MAG: HEAT repeat domain-containing protein [Planctomycetia bacterium]|nr:HEAT repeat domain-containing protein [Planctomycetia bacterium]
MSPLDQLLQARTERERNAALKGWTKVHGPVFEFMVTINQPGVVALLVPADRFAELLEAYQRSRHHYLKQLSEQLPQLSFDNDEFEYHLLVYSLAEHLEGDLEPIRPIMEKMLLEKDTEIMGVATKLFERMGVNCWASWPVIRKAFACQGMWESPFHLGNAVAATVREKPDRLEAIRTALQAGKEKEQQALCHVLVELGPLANPLTDDVIRITLTPSASPDTISCAIMALGYLGEKNAEISAILRHAIGSEHWFVRANAIASAGQLRLEPEMFVPLIIQRLQDDFGYDGWSASNAAVKALGQYGPDARIAREPLIVLQNSTDDEDMQKAISEALTPIR